MLSPDPGRGYRAVRAADWFVVALLFGTAAYLYVNLFVLPNTPYLLGGDQTYFWTDAQRMLFGERPYEDFFQFTPPGTDLFYFALFKLFGPRIWVTNVVVLGLGVALCWACFNISRQIMGRGTALLATLLFLTLVYTKLLNATHHWFSVLLTMIAIGIAMRRTTLARIAAAGMLLGLASFFTHTHAVAATLAFILFLIWQQSRAKQPLRFLFQRVGLLIFAFGLTWFASTLPFLLRIGAKELWYYQVTFVTRYMVHTPEGAFLGLPEVPSWRRFAAVSQYFLVYAVLAVIYPLSLWQCWLRRQDDEFPDWDRITLLCLVGSALCVEVAFSLNWLRAFAVSMPAIILLIRWLDQDGHAGRSAIKLIWVGVVCLAVFQVRSKHHGPYVVAELPGGRAAVSPQAYERLDWVMHHTRPGDFFFEPPAPSLYLPLGLRSPVFVEGLGTDEQTTPEMVNRTIQQMETIPVRYVLWSPHLDGLEAGQSRADHLLPFRAFLHDHYDRVWIFSDHEEIWEHR